MTTSAFRAYSVPATDGFLLAAREFSTPLPPRAIAMIAPAMGVRQDFYAPFAAWLATQGVIVLTFDYRGMGESRPAALRGFDATIVDWATKDCPALIDDVAARHPNLPIFWLGHSVGAQILGLLPNRDRIKAMLSIAAGSGYWQYNAAPLRYYVLSMWLVVMPIALKLAGYFPGRKLGTVGDLPYGVAEQWRRWCLHKEYLATESDAIRDAIGSTRTPITALSMQDDEMMTMTGTKALFGLYASAPVEYRRLKPESVGVKRIGHFGFFRAAMEEPLWPLVTQWMTSSTANAAAAHSS